MKNQRYGRAEERFKVDLISDTGGVAIALRHQTVGGGLLEERFFSHF